MLSLDTAIHDEKPFWNRVRACLDGPATVERSPPEFKELARVYGHDFAVGAVFEHVRRMPAHCAFAERLDAVERCPSKAQRGMLVGIVPGAFHRERPETGAGGEVLLSMLQSLGFAAQRVPLPNLAPCRHNAEALDTWVRRHIDRPLVIVSLSKGSLDVLEAFKMADHGLRHCRLLSWISLSGILQGTPLVDWLRRRRLRWMAARGLAWWRGLDCGALSEMSYQPGRLFASTGQWLSNVRMAHVIGFPRLRDLSSRLARRVVRRTADFGPNDGGGIVLADVIGWPGLVYPVWGADHYLQPPARLSGLIQRLLAWATEKEP
jgi:hypothetical protein